MIKQRLKILATTFKLIKNQKVNFFNHKQTQIYILE